MKSGEMAANIARELAEHTRNHLYAGDITYSVSAMVQLVNLLDVQLRNLTPGGKDSAARSLNKVRMKVRGKDERLKKGLADPGELLEISFWTGAIWRQWFFLSEPEYLAVFVYSVFYSVEKWNSCKCRVYCWCWEMCTLRCIDR